MVEFDFNMCQKIHDAVNFSDVSDDTTSDKPAEAKVNLAECTESDKVAKIAEMIKDLSAEEKAKLLNASEDYFSNLEYNFDDKLYMVKRNGEKQLVTKDEMTKGEKAKRVAKKAAIAAGIAAVATGAAIGGHALYKNAKRNVPDNFKSSSTIIPKIKDTSSYDSSLAKMMANKTSSQLANIRAANKVVKDSSPKDLVVKGANGIVPKNKGTTSSDSALAKMMANKTNNQLAAIRAANKIVKDGSSKDLVVKGVTGIVPKGNRDLATLKKANPSAYERIIRKASNAAKNRTTRHAKKKASINKYLRTHSEDDTELYNDIACFSNEVAQPSERDLAKKAARKLLAREVAINGVRGAGLGMSAGILKGTWDGKANLLPSAAVGALTGGAIGAVRGANKYSKKLENAIENERYNSVAKKLV